MLIKLFNKKQKSNKNNSLKTDNKNRNDNKNLLFDYMSTLNKIEDLYKLNLMPEERERRIISIVQYKKKEVLDKIIELDCKNEHKQS